MIALLIVVALCALALLWMVLARARARHEPPVLTEADAAANARPLASHVERIG